MRHRAEAMSSGRFFSSGGETMLSRPQRRCPHCNDNLDTSHDMWGEIYLCEECGFATEDDGYVPETNLTKLTFVEQIYSQQVGMVLERR